MSKKRFVIRRHLFRGQTTGGWYIWDKLLNSWAECVENKMEDMEKRSYALKVADELNAYHKQFRRPK